MSESPNLERIDDIMAETVFAVQRGKEQIFQIGDLAREEYLRIQAELESIQSEASSLAARTEELDRRAKASRSRLAEISQDFGRYAEDDIRKAYELAQEAQVQLMMARQQDNDLRSRRSNLDHGARHIEQMVNKSEDLVNTVSMAMDFLTGKLDGLTHQLRGLKLGAVVSRQVIKAQEEERRRIAREIHDGPAQAMANIVLRAEICEKIMATGKGNLPIELAELKRLVKDCLREVRRIIFDLRPMTLDDLGLVPTLTRYIEDLKAQTGMDVRLVIFGKERRLDPNTEGALFRLIQEALTNVRKYAKAKEVGVNIEYGATRLRVEVQDDGVGFETTTVNKDLVGRDHFGLLSMRERVELLNGSFELISALGKGTCVSAEIPLVKGAGTLGVG